MIKQMVLEMEESVNKATLAVANAIANEKSLERKSKRLEKNPKTGNLELAKPCKPVAKTLPKPHWKRRLLPKRTTKTFCQFTNRQKKQP
jgi:hypothetical protein